MKIKTEVIDFIMAVGPIIWILLLCFIILFQLPIFPFMLYTGGIYLLVMSMISIAVIFISFKDRNKCPAVICIVLVVISYCIGFVCPVRAIDNPFTPQQFAVLIKTNMFSKGTLTYYRRAGCILYEPKTLSGEFTMDNNFVEVSSDVIHVASAWGEGSDYQIKNDHLSMKKNVNKFVFYKRGSGPEEYFELGRTSLVYYKGINQQKICLLTKSENRKLRQQLEQLKLADNERNSTYYQLDAEIINDNAIYLSYVDGEKLFEYMYDFIMESQAME